MSGITNDGVTAEQKAQVVAAITRTLQTIFVKRPEHTHIIDEIDRENWGFAGVLTTEYRMSTSRLVVSLYSENVRAVSSPASIFRFLSVRNLLHRSATVSAAAPVLTPTRAPPTSAARRFRPAVLADLVVECEGLLPPVTGQPGHDAVDEAAPPTVVVNPSAQLLLPLAAGTWGRVNYFYGFLGRSGDVVLRGAVFPIEYA